MAVMTERSAGDTTIRPFKVEIPEAELEDLRARLRATRFPERETVEDDSQGVPLAAHAGPRSLLGDRVRLAQVRGAAERRPELHHRDRRAGHPLHPRSLQARGRAPAGRLPRLARLDRRAAEAHRPAHRSHRARREHVGRLPRRDPLDAGLRVLRQADHDRLGSRTHRQGLRRAHEAPRLRAVRGAGRRLGRDRRRRDGRRPRRPGGSRARAAGADRHPHQPGRRDPAGPLHRVLRRQSGAVRSLRRGAEHLRAAAHLLRDARGVRADHGDASADALRPGGLTDRPRRVHARPRRRERSARHWSSRSSRSVSRGRPTSRATTSWTTSRCSG